MLCGLRGTILITLSILNACNAELKMIQATIRHGDRYPSGLQFALATYPNDPHINNTWVTSGEMLLTEKGKSNAYKMGVLLRERYNELLGLKYDPDVIYMRSSPTNRTIDTGRLIAAGIYPELKPLTFSSNHLDDIKVSMFSKPFLEDTLHYSMLLCKNYRLDRIKSDAQVNELLGILTDVQKFYDYLSLHTGVKHTRIFQSFELYHNLASHTSLGLQLEPWVHSVFPSGKLVDFASIEYKLQSYTTRMKRLLGGVWIKKFLDTAYDFKHETNTNRKAYFYFSHETQIVGILNTLGVYKPHVPSYLSSVIFELHEIDNTFYVKVIYKNENKFTDLVIPGCQKSLCELGTFKKVLENVIPDDFETDCGKRGLFYSSV
ncbi:venom acid phosphatase Acph-1-like [Microplitis demolitor]|uniref:venom acid phosphatase Acph-1-like n=1 Tax=Microplitis demolitor TaxID=69319 RepID=UPI0004CD02D0|nr:venom acid phosphatase Acph-1-like [Microplitis demolitor]